MDSDKEKSQVPTLIREKMKMVSDLIQNITKDYFSDYYNKGAENKTLCNVLTVLLAALTLLFFIVRWNNVSFVNALFAFLLPLGYYRPGIEKKTFRIILAVAVALFFVLWINDPWIHFSTLFPIILIYIIGETIRYVGWILGGYLYDRGEINKTSSLLRDLVYSNSYKRTLLIVTAIIAVTIIAVIIIVPSRSSGVPYGIEDPRSERSNSAIVSSSGTYYWSNGALSLTITISGDRWYSTANFDVVSRGRIKNEALYDEMGIVQLGRIISSNSITYSNMILNRK